MDGVEDMRSGATMRSPYDSPEHYDRILDGLDFDQAFWLRVARGWLPGQPFADEATAAPRRAPGPVLDVGCGTGRVLMRLLEAGIDADGLDNSEPMLARARERATALGKAPRLVLGDMRDFTLPRRYARALCTFNAFAHCDTTDDQIRALRCIREHLEPEGALVLFMSYPKPSYWSEPDGDPVLETEAAIEGTDRKVQMWDTRFKDPVEQRQRSQIEIREVDATGKTVASHRSEITQRWVYRYELDLLLRIAGYGRREIHGGFAGEPFTSPDQPLIAWGWRS